MHGIARLLAKKLNDTLGDDDIEEIDVIIPVPQASNTASAVVSEQVLERHGAWHGIDLASSQELVAHGKTRHDIANTSGWTMYYMRTSISVFCGKYKTQIPDGGFERLSQIRGKKPRQVARQPQASGNSGPWGTAADGSPTVVDGINGQNGIAASITSRMKPTNPRHCEDLG
ncbi:amidophosphoribosyltransferase [Tolypocladium capitatum]|uniref:Amidophosphoribosyltransferase n=1 Tax=Tolypocladium capitatum TaxID=45235 RepID=A0A2K3QMP8_9HYPO|nr:amidophosphoribosyltransferase [Tolypocladium capitatum]